MLVVDQLSECNDDKMLEIKCVANVLLFEIFEILYNFHIERRHKLNYSSNSMLCCLTPVIIRIFNKCVNHEDSLSLRQKVYKSV